MLDMFMLLSFLALNGVSTFCNILACKFQEKVVLKLLLSHLLTLQSTATGNPPDKKKLRKSTPQKYPPIVQASTHTVESLFYKYSYIQVGDIVSLMDAEHNAYYAQIRGLLVDTYCEKSAFLTWLIPTQVSPNPNDCFDPSPDEEQSRKLSCLEFVMHESAQKRTYAPSNYYHDKTTPFHRPIRWITTPNPVDICGQICPRRPAE